MMEFTVSRCVLMMCGIILLGAVAEPVGDYLSNYEDDRIDLLAQHDAELFDRFAESEIEEAVIYGDALMPDGSYSLTLDGNRLVLTDNEGAEYTACTRNIFDRVVLGYADSVILHGKGHKVTTIIEIEEDPADVPAQEQGETVLDGQDHAM